MESKKKRPALGKPVLVLRNATERPAIITEKLGLLIGTDKNNIIHKVGQLLTNKKMYAEMARGGSPYGDGHAAERIVDYLKNKLLYLEK